ncbi:DUF2490 domain-containing protein [Mucilaginibacter limnophilus]|uniref:DUF2490 domain-containing protein n=1 Tax=Mucilaginibacter limnophilus TaxID=1932778 RepID=A0A437MR99_9SPHI|nr:DUF2490 domain-containing protein [Mucilaginibacter limnophilus]RVU00177.1 DUF2490 domain-containing protein [Mucilaginibacter limnophilus]
MLGKRLFSVICLLILIVCSSNVRAQNGKTGTWGIVTVTLPGDSTHRWGGYIELQTRTNTFFNQAFYYEVKGGISYDIAKNYTALIGTGRYVTYDYNELDEPPTVLETRLWEQMTVNQLLDRIKIEHRYRIEQRFFDHTPYRNRFRYRLNLAIPINHRKVEPKTYYAAVFDEIFLNNKAPHFERNRLYVGMGYQFNKSLSLQLGWMQQYNYSLNSASTGGKNNLAINVQYRFNRKNTKPKEHIPGMQD